MRLLISACLLGCRCRYDGGSKPLPDLDRLLSLHQLVPVCPEQLGGLPTPRPPCEIRGGRVLSQAGDDCTEAFERGAEEAMRLYRLFRCEAALLKSRSPSCGKGWVYDGSFSNSLRPGHGILAERLIDTGARVCTEDEIGELL